MGRGTENTFLFESIRILIKMPVIKVHWILNCLVIPDFLKKGIKVFFHNLITTFKKMSKYSWLDIFLEMIQLRFFFILLGSHRKCYISPNLEVRNNSKSNEGIF